MKQNDPNMPDGDQGCGRRLRKAREAAGLSQADVAARLKMPVRVVNSLEEEDWSRLGAPVFVRGQLRSYSRLLGLTTAPMMDASGVAPIEPPNLTPRTFIPTSRRITESLARRFVYIVLTAAIAIPVWLATRSHLGDITHDAAPLDIPTLGTTPTRDGGGPGNEIHDPGTVVASLASLPARHSASKPMTSPSATTASTPVLSLRVEGDSWVEVIGSDGQPLEQSLLRAGEHRQYARGEVARVVLGNAAAVQVRHDGKAQDLTPFKRANVARFTVSSDGSLAPAAD